ncbi:hypothetical protein FKM82_020040 [Ascaphus truei]
MYSTILGTISSWQKCFIHDSCNKKRKVLQILHTCTVQCIRNTAYDFVHYFTVKDNDASWSTSRDRTPHMQLHWVFWTRLHR